MSLDDPASEPIELIVAEEQAGQRLDVYLAAQFPAFSRTHLRRAINAVGILVNGLRSKASHHVRSGERISVVLPKLPREGPQPENIPLEILYEDDWIAAINKPPGMVVHQGRGHWQGTLTAALQFHFDHLSSLAGETRPGIVHRLDRDTSGAMVVAKTDRAHFLLARQFADRTVEKEYLAIVAGSPDRDRDWIELPIGLHPYHREKMAVRHDHPSSKPAASFYEVVERFDGFACVRILPKTGRTHQIRVHLASIGCPVLCDRLYSSRARLTRGELLGEGEDETPVLERQALHARRLKLAHPTTGQPLDFETPLPEDFRGVLALLRAHRRL